MRGDDERIEGMFSFVRPEQRVPKEHPLRPIREIVDRSVGLFVPAVRGALLAHGTAVDPTREAAAVLLQAFYSVHSVRQLMEQLEYNLLFRWFAGLSMDATVWDATTFTKNRGQLLDGDIARKFLASGLNQPGVRRLLSKEHVSVDGSLIENWASMKKLSAQGRIGRTATGGGRNAERDFHGEKCTNATHAPTTDPDARLYRKSLGQGAKLCHKGHLLMENRHGLIVETELTPATGWGERAAAEAMIEDLPRAPHATLAADRAYDTAAFVARLREGGVVPRVAQNISGRRSAIDGRTTQHPSYGVSQRARKRIEEAFGWIKTIGGLRKTRHRGRDKVRWTFTLTATTYNVIRLPKLLNGLTNSA